MVLPEAMAQSFIAFGAAFGMIDVSVSSTSILAGYRRHAKVAYKTRLDCSVSLVLLLLLLLYSFSCRPDSDMAFTTRADDEGIDPAIVQSYVSQVTLLIKFQIAIVGILVYDSSKYLP